MSKELKKIHLDPDATATPKQIVLANSDAVFQVYALCEYLICAANDDGNVSIGDRYAELQAQMGQLLIGVMGLRPNDHANRALAGLNAVVAPFAKPHEPGNADGFLEPKP